MRILYLHQYFVTPRTSGATRSYEMARRLIAAGHEVCVVTSSALLPPEQRHSTQGQTIDVDGVPVVVIDVPYGNEMPFSQRILAFLKFALLASREAMRHKADVIIATSTPLTIALPGIVGKLWQRRPLVFEVRDLWPELPIAIGALNNPVLQWVASALEWIAYHASAHVIALSPGMADGVVRRGIPRERVTVIPNSCDLALFDVPAERGDKIRAQLGLSEGQPLLVYTGTFGHINGVGYLVDLAEAMKTVAPEVRFLIVGAGVEFDKVQARAKALGVLDSNLFLWAPIAKNEVPDLLAAATVAASVFVPIKEMWNNSANKFFDALAARKPIAINYGGWQAELLEKHAAGLVLPPEDIPAAARQLADFLHDPQRVAAAGQAAARLGREQFDRDDMARKLEAVLTQATGRAPGIPAAEPASQ